MSRGGSKVSNEELLQFLQQSPTPFHAVSNMVRLLEQAGFHRLDEISHWELKKNSSYFVVRNDSALVAFNVGSVLPLNGGLRLFGAHTDSPSLKVKPNPEINNHGYVQLGVEVYGSALLKPWFDRDLSIAGRVDFQTKSGEINSTLIDFGKPIAFIPSLAIHLDRQANDGHKINSQKELRPILLQARNEEKFRLDELLLNLVRKQYGNEAVEQVLSHELLLYDTQPAQLVGLEQQFIASARLDNLLSCYLGCKALMSSGSKHASVLVCNDHEEVGSVSTSGAQGPFLRSVLQRLIRGFHQEEDAFQRVARQSIFLSVDNAHGVHPNFSEKHDDQHYALLNGGPVIKINANQRYASNSQSIALFKSLCNKLSIPYQSFVMRNDMACGSTIGPITAAELGITTVDVGIASFGMHSIRELAGIKDIKSMLEIAMLFFDQ